MPARRVVAGFGPDGKSTIVADEPTPTRVERPGGSVIVDLWQVPGLPARMAEDDGLGGQAGGAPPPGGAIFRICTFPPEKDMDMEAFEAAMVETYGPQDHDTDVPGMHRTDTVDVLTVLSGELHVILENGETVLRPGDSLIQRGTPHAWSNRSEEPATVVAVMMSAEP